MTIFLEFENDNLTVTFHPIPDSKATKFKLKIYAKNVIENLEKKHVYTSNEWDLLQDKENSHNFSIDYKLYNLIAKKVVGSGFLPNQIELYFSIEVDGKEYEVQNTCKVHLVRYIPKLLNLKGWENGEKLQKIWFTKGNNSDKKKVNPELNAVTWDWIISESSEVNNEFNKLHNETRIALNQSNSLWSNNVQKALQNEIAKMFTEGFAIRPTKNNKTTTFGTSLDNIVEYRGEKIPQFEKYYFNHKAFSGFWDLGWHYLVDGIDDFIAAIANFNFHVYATGELKYIERSFDFLDDYITVKVNKLHYYVKDAFDFVDDNPSEPSQPLGYWKVSEDGTTVEVERSAPSNKKEYFEVTNLDYRNYRDDHKMGYDFYLYSTIHEETVNIEFDL